MKKLLPNFHLFARRLSLLAAAAICCATVTVTATAQPAPYDPARFPAAAVRFLDSEIPQMEAAVVARDREFFEGATERMVAFSEDWGFKAHANPALAAHAACTSAVSDYVVVGLCRLAPGNDACDPTLAALFASNLGRCRQSAMR